ncbi:MAG: flagellar protein FlaG [Minwuia sp.]|uniref:flagellar protein FlaG n=1 Tax=Minwuia sp. TaxID=2493630 RepID=UPI003A87F779
MIDATAGLSPGVEKTRPVTASERSDNRKNEQQPKAAKAEEPTSPYQRSEDPVVDRRAAAETLAKAMFTEFPSNASLEIDVNEQADGFIYKAVDPDTGEVIKQFPAAQVLERLERLSRMQGLAVDGSV